MRAAIHHEFGASNVLHIEDVPDPEMGHGDVLLRVRATAVNRLDVLQRQGPPLLPLFTLPHIAGMDVVGEIVDVGSSVTTRHRGERVVLNPALPCGRCPECQRGDDALCPNARIVGGNRPGGYAEWVVVPAQRAHLLPDTIDDLSACALPTAYSTAWHALIKVGRLSIGETLLVHGAGSSVSLAALQIARHAGARVIVSGTSAAKLEVARGLGADTVLINTDPGFVDAVRGANDGRGVDMVFDHVGPALFNASLYCLRPRGRLVFCGTTTGNTATFDLPFAYHFGICLLGSDPYGYEEFEAMLAYCLAACFRAPLDSEFALAEARGAQERMEDGNVIGKIVLRP